VARRRAAFLRCCGLEGRRLTLLHQVHGATILDGGSLALGGHPLVGDGALSVAGDPGAWVPAVRWADCVPMLLAGGDGRAVAAVHAGWRGIVAGVVGSALERLGARGAGTETLVAAIGPAIGPCCYEVGEEVALAVSRASGAAPEGLAVRRDRRTLDLRAAVRSQLVRAGVPERAIEVAPWCTRCEAELFDSHRRLGAASGRQMACIGRTEDAAP